MARGCPWIRPASLSCAWRLCWRGALSVPPFPRSFSVDAFGTSVVVSVCLCESVSMSVCVSPSLFVREALCRPRRARTVASPSPETAAQMRGRTDVSASVRSRAWTQNRSADLAGCARFGVAAAAAHRDPAFPRAGQGCRPPSPDTGRPSHAEGRGCSGSRAVRLEMHLFSFTLSLSR